MSANLDLVRSIYADWERGDFSKAEWADQEIEFVLADGPEPGRWIGVVSMAHAWESRLVAFQDLRAKPEAYRELDDERVLVLVHHSGRGKVSGIELTRMRGPAALFRVSRGKVTSLWVYVNRDRAFADLGLTPGGGAQ